MSSYQREADPTNRPPLVLKKGPPTMEAEVFYNSITLQGEPFAHWYLKKIQDPNNAGVIAVGESGAGKTTEMGQGANEAIRLSDGVVWLTVLTSAGFLRVYEPQVKFYLEAYIKTGKDPEWLFEEEVPLLLPNREFTRSNFTPRIWLWCSETFADNSNAIIEAVLNPRTFPTDRPKRFLADVAGMGESITTTRLASGIRKVVQAFPKEIAVAVFPGNPEIQDRSYRGRVKSEDVLTRLSKARGSEKILSPDEIIKRQPLSPEEEEEIKVFLHEERLVTDTDLLSTVASIREGTRPDRFQGVRKKLFDEAHEWSDTVDYGTAIDPVFRQLRRLQLEGKFTMANEVLEGLYGLKLAYGQHYLEEHIGIPPDSDQGRVVLVPFLETDIHQWPELMRRKSG